MYFDPSEGLSLVLLDTVDEGEDVKSIDTECGVVISPVALAEVIVYGEDGTKLVFEAVHGRLPCNGIVVGIKNGSGAFPDTDAEVKIKAFLSPYQPRDSVLDIEATVKVWEHGCPICGKLEGGEESETTEDVAPTSDDSCDDLPGDEWKHATEKPKNRLDFLFRSENEWPSTN